MGENGADMDATEQAALQAYVESQQELEPVVAEAIVSLRDGFDTGNEKIVTRGMALLQQAKDELAQQRPTVALTRPHNQMNRALSLLLEAARAGIQGIKAGDDSRVRFARDRVHQANQLMDDAGTQVTRYFENLNRRPNG
jgi:hypothetical protein